MLDRSAIAAQPDFCTRFVPLASSDVPQFPLEIAQALLLGTHLLAIGVAASGPIICILLSWRTEIESPAFKVGRKLAWWSVGGLLVGMILGTLSLFLLSDQSYWEVLSKVPEGDLWFAGSELLFSLVCLVTYAATWKQLQRRRGWHGLIGLVSVTNLLYHFPPLMIVLGQLTDGSAQLNSDWLDRATLLELMFRQEVVAPWLHFVLATYTIAGGAALWLFSRQQITASESEEPEGPVRKVAIATLVVSISQLPIGLWLVTTIPQSSRAALMGKSAVASLAFLAAMLVVFLLLGRLIKIALGEFTAEDLRKAALWMVLVVLAMAISTRSSREQSPLANLERLEKKDHGEGVSVAPMLINEFRRANCQHNS